MRLISYILPLVLASVSACVAMGEDLGEPDDVDPVAENAKLAPDKRAVGDLSALSDTAFFAHVRYQPVAVTTLPDGMIWARSSYLATVDMVDGIRFSTDHRGQISLFLLADGRYQADYTETQWQRTTGEWTVTTRRALSGLAAIHTDGKIVLAGLGVGKRTIVQGRAAVVIQIDKDIASHGAAGQTFIAQQALSSAAFEQK
jgi:hypothetical protein